MEGAVIGGPWLARTSDADFPKQVIVIISCFGWGIIGAMFCIYYTERFQQKLGFILGGVFGILLTCGFILAIRDPVNKAAVPDYEGWDTFAMPTLALPAAIL